jgi:gluconate 5-dehydrogenase
MLGDKIMEKAPLKRMGGPEDLKGAVVLLASDASAFITGQVITVDGGVTAI